MADELHDILRNRVKEKLARDEVVSSMTVRLLRGIPHALIEQAATGKTKTIAVSALLADPAFHAIPASRA